MSETLYATFDDAALAEKAVGALLDYGVRHEDISILSKEPSAYRTEQANWPARDDRYINQPINNAEYVNRPITNNTSVDSAEHTENAAKGGLSTTTAADAEVGAAKGAGIGLGVGVAAAIASLVIPGFGLVIGGGALATAIAGAAGATAAGAVAGGVTGYLKDQGVPEVAATNYHRAYENGSAVLALVIPSGDVTRIDAEGILAKYQATNINVYGASPSYVGRA
jgi:hypothetical protein